jgi:hypothetical protein
MRVRLLNCLAGALVKHGVRFLVNLAPGGEVIYDIAADTWEKYRRGGGPTPPGPSWNRSRRRRPRS